MYFCIEMNTVLLIESDRIFKENLIELLQLEGFRVKSAENLSEADEVLNHTIPSFIICDEYAIYGEFEKLQNDLKEAHKNSSILILNSDGSNENFKDADAYLKMPFRDDKLFSKLGEMKRK